MNYEKKYKMALETIQEILNNRSDSIEMSKLKLGLQSAFPELKESEDEKIRKAIVAFFECQDDNTTYSFVPKQSILAWLEKQGKKKSTDVELRFKIGDWVVSKYDVWHVDSFDKKYCQVSNGEGDDCYFEISKQDDFHLWTIEDAKDGDVLVNGSNIFKFHFIIGTRVRGYCHVNTDDGRFYNDIGNTECFGLIDDVFTPATKEQRDVLFARMKDAGYEWDAEKKELKRI